MNLVIQDIWSPDLKPPSEGQPDDLENYRVLIQVALSEVGHNGREMFGLTVTSPSKCAAIEPPAFITHTLVLNSFSWELVRAHIEKLLRHCSSADNWDQAIRILSPYLRYSDE